VTYIRGAAPRRRVLLGPNDDRALVVLSSSWTRSNEAAVRRQLGAQIALLVVPIAVLASLVLGHHMALVFNPFDLGAIPMRGSWALAS
jgi:hypothetical protein